LAGKDFNVTNQTWSDAKKVYLAGWSVTPGSLTYGDFGALNSFHMYSNGYITKDAGETKVINGVNTTITYYGQKVNKKWKLGVGNHFGVTENGELYCTSGNFSGTITADNGYIGGTSGW
jgi:hypothetical protein